MASSGSGVDQPTDDTRQALQKQLAFYFSDANLRRDRFLRQRTGQRGTGSVPLSVLLTFNKVKAITTSEAVLADALAAVPGLALSKDSLTVCRALPLPEDDDSGPRTVYMEELPPNFDHEALSSLVSRCGKVEYLSLPRLPGGASKGFAFIEFALVSQAQLAVSELDGHVPEGASGGKPLRVMLKRAWETMKAEYKRLLDEGKAAESARAAALEAAAKEGSAAVAEEAAAAATEQRRVVAISGIPRGGGIKAARRVIREAFGAVAPVEYVDYGVSNSGDPTVGYVRMLTPVGAAEAARVLLAQDFALNGAPVRLQVLSGDRLREYTAKLDPLRKRVQEVSKMKRARWWEKKWGGGGGEAAPDGEQQAQGSEGGNGEPDASPGKRPADGDEGSSKRPRVEPPIEG